MTGREPIIDIRNVSMRFDDTLVLEDISLSIANGEFLTFLGPSGCGKTTLLRLLAGFESPTSGDIFINGQRMNDVPPHRREVNTVFQSYALFPHMTVFENVAFGLRRKKLPASEIKGRVAEMLALVKLEGLGGRRPAQLSGGQQQRVALARAVVNRPLVLLLDEPLSALDFKLRTQMQMELKHLQRRLGITFVFVTHDQAEAFAMSDRVAVMSSGHITQRGTPQEIYENPQNLFVASFVGEINILDAVITGHAPDHLEATIEGRRGALHSRRDYPDGQRVKVLLRPEDLRLSRPEDPEAAEACFSGVIKECTYKGATVDIQVEIEGGKVLQATEFFNEDSEDIDYRPGEPVRVSWVRGWETVLPDD
jgi:spermidine/putrescine transport system ATP-binding protein